jgi:hypothetical protein
MPIAQKAINPKVLNIRCINIIHRFFFNPPYRRQRREYSASAASHSAFEKSGQHTCGKYSSL